MQAPNATRLAVHTPCDAHWVPLGRSKTSDSRLLGMSSPGVVVQASLWISARLILSWAMLAGPNVAATRACKWTIVRHAIASQLHSRMRPVANPWLSKVF